jgi:hypothetical protein
MRQLGFDHVRMDIQLFDQDSSCHRAKAVGSHIFVRVAHPTERRSNRVLAHRTLAREQAWKHVLAMPGYRMDI